MRSAAAALASVADQAACRDRLDLVDAAIDRPGGPAAHKLANVICPWCPIAAECLAAALESHERGTWGGATERQRRKRLGTSGVRSSASQLWNLRTIHPPGRP